jgi:hypothetical protein
LTPLITAIFRHEAGTARQLAQLHPEQLSMRAEAGMLPADLAFAAGDTEIGVALLRAGAPTDTPDRHWAHLHRDWMAEMSQKHFLAGWLHGLEHMLWDWLETGRWDDESFLEPDEALRLDLAFLRNHSLSWPEHRGGEIVAVPLDEWAARSALRRRNED